MLFIGRPRERQNMTVFARNFLDFERTFGGVVDYHMDNNALCPGSHAENKCKNKKKPVFSQPSSVRKLVDIEWVSIS